MGRTTCKRYPWLLKLLLYWNITDRRPDLKLCEIQGSLWNTKQKSFSSSGHQNLATAGTDQDTLSSEDWLLLTEVGWWVLIRCLSALRNWNTSTATGSLAARLHRRLHSGLHTHLQVRLLPAGLRFCKIFLQSSFCCYREGRCSRLKGMLLWCWKISSELETKPEANQMFCFILLMDSEMKRITLPEAFNYED